jgi:hypothetical protein
VKLASFWLVQSPGFGELVLAPRTCRPLSNSRPPLASTIRLVSSSLSVAVLLQLSETRALCRSLDVTI